VHFDVFEQCHRCPFLEWPTMVTSGLPILPSAILTASYR
jgi:hypothetical protein